MTIYRTVAVRIKDRGNESSPFALTPGELAEQTAFAERMTVEHADGSIVVGFQEGLGELSEKEWANMFRQEPLSPEWLCCVEARYAIERVSVVLASSPQSEEIPF